MTPAPISVERFDPEIGRELLDPPTETYRQVAVMEPFFAGEYVRHSDYAALLHQLAEREAEVASLRTDVETLVKMKQHQEDRAEAAERAREEATGLLREVEPEINELSNIYYSEFSNTKREKETEALHSRIAAFLAASGGGREA